MPNNSNIGESPNLVGGILEFKVDGVAYYATGEYKYNLGGIKRTAIKGGTKINGWSGEVQVPYIEGEITDAGGFNLEDFINLVDVSPTLTLASGIIVELEDGFYAGDGDVGSKEGNVQVRFEGLSATRVR